MTEIDTEITFSTSNECEDCHQAFVELTIDERTEVYCATCDLANEKPAVEEGIVEWEQCKECEAWLAPWYPWLMCPKCAVKE